MLGRTRCCPGSGGEEADRAQAVRCRLDRAGNSADTWAYSLRWCFLGEDQKIRPGHTWVGHESNKRHMAVQTRDTQVPLTCQFNSVVRH